jgi:hypothetical protein
MDIFWKHYEEGSEYTFSSKMARGMGERTDGYRI